MEFIIENLSDEEKLALGTAMICLDYGYITTDSIGFDSMIDYEIACKILGRS